MSLARVLLWTLVLTALIEGTTVFLRFGLGLQSTRDTAFLRTLTLGLRIHHGYVGVLLIAAAWMWIASPGWRRLLMMLGGGLFLSDVIHHFLVLWCVTGSPEFDLFYRNGP